MEIHIVPDIFNFTVSFVLTIILLIVISKKVYKPLKNFAEQREKIEINAEEKIQSSKVILEKVEDEKQNILKSAEKEANKIKNTANKSIKKLKEENEKQIQEIRKQKEFEIQEKIKKEEKNIDNILDTYLEKQLEQKIKDIASKSFSQKDLEEINDKLIKEL